jgi:hypothetical protein
MSPAVLLVVDSSGSSSSDNPWADLPEPEPLTGAEESSADWRRSWHRVAAAALLEALQRQAHRIFRAGRLDQPNYLRLALGAHLRAIGLWDLSSDEACEGPSETTCGEAASCPERTGGPRSPRGSDDEEGGASAGNGRPGTPVAADAMG